MKIRMLFGTFVEIDGQRVELKNDTIVDVPEEIATPLLGRRAELVEPAAPAPALKKAK
jgi:hypothetical protein